jgi:magnesium transporter
LESEPALLRLGSHLAIPTIIAGIYGMNFEDMPELAWAFGYPFALAVIVVLSALLYWGFKRSG